jgi:hypothetical protein
MQLTVGLRQQLEQKVHDFVGNSPEPATVRNLVGVEASQRVPPGLNGYGYARWIVTYSLSQQTPAVFVRVVEESDLAKELIDLWLLVERLQADHRMWSAPPEGLWVPDSWPFVDRKKLRQAMATMASRRGPPSIVIEGPSGHGKRTTVAYTRWLAAVTGEFQAVDVEIRKDTDPGVLFELVNRIANVLNFVPDLDTTHEEPERQAVILARDVAIEAKKGSLPTWFVVNVLGRPEELEPGVLVFVDQLLALAAKRGAKHCVVLLCDELSLLELEHAPPPRARHTLGQVGEVEVKDWLKAAVPGKEPGLYQEVAESVMSSLERKEETLHVSRRLGYLSQLCKVAHSTLVATDDA